GVEYIQQSEFLVFHRRLPWHAICYRSGRNDDGESSFPLSAVPSPKMMFPISFVNLSYVLPGSMLAASNTHEDSTMSTNVRTPDVSTPDVHTVNVRILNDAEFSQVIDHSDQPVLVDFWADWCGPCHAIA